MKEREEGREEEAEKRDKEGAGRLWREGGKGFLP